MKSTRLILIGAAMAIALGPVLALAGPDTDIGFRGWGPRVGLSLDPDQVHFGAHLDFGNFARHVRFQPNVELGFGDDMKIFTVNAEAAYRFRSQWDVWTPYLGGGLGANIKSFDNVGNNNSQTDLGVNLLGGIERGLSNGDRFFIEGKFSLNDVPDAKVTVGWTF
ncbi:MAG: outer membrane beta-barrel protein [Candidatus Eisenbacteria bacterium]